MNSPYRVPPPKEVVTVREPSWLLLFGAGLIFMACLSNIGMGFAAYCSQFREIVVEPEPESCGYVNYEDAEPYAPPEEECHDKMVVISAANSNIMMECDSGSKLERLIDKSNTIWLCHCE